MPTATGDRIDVTCRAVGIGYQCVDERRLADTAVAHQDAHAVAQDFADGIEVATELDHHDPDIERFEEGEHVGRAGADQQGGQGDRG